MRTKADWSVKLPSVPNAAQGPICCGAQSDRGSDRHVCHTGIEHRHDGRCGSRRTVRLLTFDRRDRLVSSRHEPESIIDANRSQLLVATTRACHEERLEEIELARSGPKAPASACHVDVAEHLHICRKHSSAPSNRLDCCMGLAEVSGTSSRRVFGNVDPDGGTVTWYPKKCCDDGDRRPVMHISPTLQGQRLTATPSWSNPTIREDAPMICAGISVSAQRKWTIKPADHVHIRAAG